MLVSLPNGYVVKNLLLLLRTYEARIAHIKQEMASQDDIRTLTVTLVPGPLVLGPHL